MCRVAHVMSTVRLLWASFPGGPQYGGPYEESVEHHGRLVEPCGAVTRMVSLSPSSSM